MALTVCTPARLVKCLAYQVQKRFSGNDTSGYAQAKAFAEEADVVIIAVGLTGAAVTADGSPLLEGMTGLNIIIRVTGEEMPLLSICLGEFVDREQLELPAVQQGLVYHEH